MKDPLEKLITSYRKKLDYKPENAALLSQIAEFYYTQGKLEEALSACQQALQLQPGLATASLTLKKVEQSLADLDSWTPGLAIKNWLELDAESVSNYPDIIVRMFQGEVSGMLIKQVFSKEEIAQVIYRLKSEKEAWVAHKLGSILGSPFLKPGIDGTQYFMEALTWRVELSHIFVDFETRVEAILGKMSGMKTVELPRESIDKTYIPANLRTFPPAQAIHRPHAENEFLENTSAASGTHLNEMAKLKDSLSYFIVISKPEQGGELIVYDLLWEQTPLYLKEQVTSRQREATLEKFDRKYINPDVGDMVLFNAGRLWHTVSDIKGTKSRITIGGFVSLARDEQKIFYWC